MESIVKELLLLGMDVILDTRFWILGMSLTDLARHLGISVPYVGKVLRGERPLQPEMVIN